ncbi:MAG TPA: acetyl-CoA carboxylase carboxyl transferase subunit alpha, partial [Spirochaetia bacterium]|nr:acetyl-CoA carboxylase carboxyl transferase subunit alpha [Spirochaetia bacterium]
MSEDALRDKLLELKGLAEQSNVDVSRELAALELKLRIPPVPPAPENEAWRRVELARHPERPTTLQYAELIFDD